MKNIIAFYLSIKLLFGAYSYPDTTKFDEIPYVRQKRELFGEEEEMIELRDILNKYGIFYENERKAE